MEKGEFTAIMGASGFGKSTLLNVIATIDRSSSGSILLEGNDIAGMREQDLAAFRRNRHSFWQMSPPGHWTVRIPRV